MKMNNVLCSFFLVLVAGVSVAVVADECCPFPFTAMYGHTNITKAEFKCKEPVLIFCAVTGAIGNTPVVGVAGFKKASEVEKYDIIIKGNYLVNNTATCNPSNTHWKAEGTTSEYERFACAYQNYGGDWWIAP